MFSTPQVVTTDALKKALLSTKQNTYLVINNKTKVSRDLTLYVSTEGSDELGDGSENRPFASLQRAIDELGQICYDCTIKITEGIYNTESCCVNTLGDNLTITSYSGNKDVVLTTFSHTYRMLYTLYNRDLDLYVSNIIFRRPTDYATSLIVKGKNLHLKNVDFETSQNSAVVAFTGGVSSIEDVNVSYIGTQGYNYAGISIGYGVVFAKNISVLTTGNYTPWTGNIVNGILVKNNVNWKARNAEDRIFENGVVIDRTGSGKITV